jgi:hypothetical protein
VSDDGNVVVATSWEAGSDASVFPDATFVWDATNGARTLDELLQDRRVDATGLEFGHARALSGDGTVLFGRAFATEYRRCIASRPRIERV